MRATNLFHLLRQRLRKNIFNDRISWNQIQDSRNSGHSRLLLRKHKATYLGL